MNLNGDFVRDKHRIIYAGSEKDERGAGMILDKDMTKCILAYCQQTE